MRFAVIAMDEQGSPVVIGPLDDDAADGVRAEIESWGWTVQSGSARSMTLAQARRDIIHQRAGVRPKLTDQQVQELKQLYETRAMTATALAKRFGIGRATLYRLVSQ